MNGLSVIGKITDGAGSRCRRDAGDATRRRASAKPASSDAGSGARDRPPKNGHDSLVFPSVSRSFEIFELFCDRKAEKDKEIKR